MRFFFTSLFTLFLLNAFAQIVPNSGTYTTSDGNYSLKVTFKDGTLTLIEPNKESTFKHASGNTYTFTNPVNNIDYAIEVVDNKTLSCYHPRDPDNRTIITFTGSAAQPSSANNFKDYKKMADDYKQKIKDDPKNGQAWAFCAAAALARASYNEAGYKEYATKAAQSLKLIAVDKTKCPCEDAIPADIWKAAK
ncbi:hypothetical protein ACFGVR_01140 [Mucilaginibacter sp. AW1-3]